MHVKTVLIVPISYIYLLALGRCLRIKRDDASFASNSGGPLAKSGKSDSGKNNLHPNNQMDDLEPCEMPNSRQEQSKSKTQDQKNTDAIVNSRIARSLSLSGDNNGKRTDDTSNEANLHSPLSLPKRPHSVTGSPGPHFTVETFEEFQVHFGKSYKSSAEKQKAARAFKDNKVVVTKLYHLRKSSLDALSDITKFSDEYFGNFKTLHTGALQSSNPVDQQKLFLMKKPLKIRKCPKLQWTERNIFPEARNQESCGSCYAQTTADLLMAQSLVEAQNWNGPVTPLSAQYLVDCGSGPNAQKCDGGKPLGIINDLASCQKKGSICSLPTESCYKYTGESGTCKKTCPLQEIPIGGAEMLDIRGHNEKDIMATLLQWGPVIALVGVTEVWQFYNGSGIIRPRQCTMDQSHAVLITGYDYTTCVPTYTVRNSWGPDWGAHGYLKLEAGKNTCGIAQSVVFACSSKCGDKNSTSFDFIAQNPNFPCHRT